jgi:hypothetical protein
MEESFKEEPDVDVGALLQSMKTAWNDRCSRRRPCKLPPLEGKFTSRGKLIELEEPVIAAIRQREQAYREVAARLSERT